MCNDLIATIAKEACCNLIVTGLRSTRPLADASSERRWTTFCIAPRGPC
jgi:hypothetical protein